MSNDDKPQAALNMVEIHNQLLKLEKDTGERIHNLERHVGADGVAGSLVNRIAALEGSARAALFLMDQQHKMIERLRRETTERLADKADRERLERAVQWLTGVGPVARADKVAELEKRIRELEVRHAEEPAQDPLPEHTHETYARYLDELIAWGNRGALLTSGETAVLDSIRKKLRGTVGR